MKLIYVTLSFLMFAATTARAGNHYNIEGSGCFPDKASAFAFTASTSGMSIKSGTPNGSYYLYCPINYADGATTSSLTFHASGSGGSAIVAGLYGVYNSSGANTFIASTGSCYAGPGVTTCGTSMIYTFAPATNTYYLLVLFNYFGSSETLINIQID